MKKRGERSTRKPAFIASSLSEEKKSILGGRNNAKSRLLTVFRDFPFSSTKKAPSSNKAGDPPPLYRRGKDSLFLSGGKSPKERKRKYHEEKKEWHP